MSIFPKKSSFLLLAPLLLTLGACDSREDLIKVQKFSQLADQAAVKAFPSLASDFYQSCLRTAHYQPLLPDSSERKVVDSRLKDIEECSDPFKADKDLQSLTPKLIAANNVLAAYMTGLGKLASDEVVDYSPELEGLEAQLGQLPGLEKQTELVEGSLGIANLLFRAATDGYRREQLQEIIVSSDPYIQEFAEGMKQIFADEYIGFWLRNEESKVDNYYALYQQNLLNNQTPGDSPTLTVALLQLDNQWQKARERVAEKKSLGQSYIGLIDTIASNHQSLSKMYGAGQEPSPETLSKVLDENTQALEIFVKEFEKINQISALVNTEE